MTLRTTIEEHAEAAGCTLDSLTVMSNMADPYRLDTPANHRLGAWMADQWDASGARRPLHLRGLHYMLVAQGDVPKPNGQPYLNSDKNWEWLQVIAGPARWLGYVPFADIIDERNAAPVDFCSEYTSTPTFRIVDPFVHMPTFDGFRPRTECDGYVHGKQAYRLVMIGEKASLATVLHPIAQRYGAELVLPTGELSTTLLHGIVGRAHADGRPCRVFYFSDFDPSGYHMAIEVSRKIQAFVEGFFPGLNIQMRRVALTAKQVRELKLPSTPLKESERRADKWRERWGTEQTEVDALSTLRPKVLRKIAEAALRPYFDDTLSDRETTAIHKASALAVMALDREMTDQRDRIEAARAAYESAIAEAQRLGLDVIDPMFSEIADAAREHLPDVEIPEAQPPVDSGHDLETQALFDSMTDWVAQTERLIGDKL